MRAVSPPFEHSGFDHLRHLRRRGLVPVRRVPGALEALGLAVGQPRVHRVSMHAELLGYLFERDPFSDGLITLFHLPELPENLATSLAWMQLVGQGVGYQPNTRRGSPGEQMSGFTRNYTRPPGSRSRHLGIQ
jgi:hypothetical protein